MREVKVKGSVKGNHFHLLGHSLRVTQAIRRVEGRAGRAGRSNKSSASWSGWKAWRTHDRKMS